MEKIHILILALSIFKVHAALVEQDKDAIHRKIEWSPCTNCDDHDARFPPGPQGPPLPSPPFGPHSSPPPPGPDSLAPPPPRSPSMLMQPPPPPDFFHTRQWGGVARDGHQHGVFSGASAAIDGGSQAFSFASTADDGDIPLLDKSPRTDNLDSLTNNQSSNVDVSSSLNSRSSSSKSFGGQSSPQLASVSTDNSDVGDFVSHNEVKHKELQTKQSGNIEDKGEIKAKYSFHGLGKDGQYSLGVVKNSANNGNQKQAVKFGSIESGGFEDGKQHSESSIHESGGLHDGLKQSGKLSNNQELSGGYASGQQQSTDFGGDLQHGAHWQHSSSSSSSQSSNLDSDTPSLSTFNSIDFKGEYMPNLQSTSSSHFSNLDSSHSSPSQLLKSVDFKGQSSANLQSPGESQSFDVDLLRHSQLPNNNDVNRQSTSYLNTLISSRYRTLKSLSSHSPLSKSDNFNVLANVPTSNGFGSKVRNNVDNFGNSKSQTLGSKFVHHELQSSQTGKSDTIDSETPTRLEHARNLVEFSGNQQKPGMFGSRHQQSVGHISNNEPIGGFEVRPQSSYQQTAAEFVNSQQQYRDSSAQQSVGFQGPGGSLQQSGNFKNCQQKAEGFENSRQIPSEYVGEDHNNLGRQQSNRFSDNYKQLRDHEGGPQQSVDFAAHGQYSDQFKNNQQRVDLFKNSKQSGFDYLSEFDDSLNACLRQCRVHLQQSKSFDGNDKESPEFEHFRQQQQHSLEFGTPGLRSENIKNEHQHSGDIENSQKSTAEYVSENNNGLRLNRQQSKGFGVDGRKFHGFEDGHQHSVRLGSGKEESGNIKNTQQQTGNPENDRIKTSEKVGFDNGFDRVAYKSQATLKDDPNLDSQGMSVAGQTEGSCCYKNSYALSNAESNNGNTLAVSLTN